MPVVRHGDVASDGSPLRGRPSVRRSSINCPVCHRLVYAKTTADGIKIIRAAGASGISGLVPFELLERRSGPPLLWDEVLDMLAGLDTTPFPQVELIDRLGVALNVNRGPNRGASSDASSTIT